LGSGSAFVSRQMPSGLIPAPFSASGRRFGGENPSELERIGTLPGHLVQFGQRPADGITTAASHEDRRRRICGILDLDREAAAVFANDLEPRPLLRRRIVDTGHDDAHRITL
jgi:hypothetical protein